MFKSTGACDLRFPFCRRAWSQGIHGKVSSHVWRACLNVLLCLTSSFLNSCYLTAKYDLRSRLGPIHRPHTSMGGVVCIQPRSEGLEFHHCHTVHVQWPLLSKWHHCNQIVNVCWSVFIKWSWLIYSLRWDFCSLEEIESAANEACLDFSEGFVETFSKMPALWVISQLNSVFSGCKALEKVC